MAKLTGILFDFDGTLAKTMEDHFLAWKRTFRDFDVSITPQDYFSLEGLGLSEVAAVIAKKYNLKFVSYDELAKKKEQYYMENLRDGVVEFYPGVLDLVKKLYEARVPMGIVTAGWYDRIIRSVPQDFLEFFNTVVTGDKIERGKPFPDPYLKGAAELGFDPQFCIGVENAPLGITSVKQAGLYCIAVASTVDRAKLKEADEIVDEFGELPATIDFLFGNRN